jgi:hypothetical protein
MQGAIGWAAQVLLPRGGIRVRQQFQMLGFYWAGFLWLVLAVLKLTIEGHWSWWRVLLPLWVVLGHNALHITVGFVWLFFADDGAAGEEVAIRQDDGPYGYQLGGDAVFSHFRRQPAGTNRGTWGEHVVVVEIGQMGADLRVWCSQCGVPASVLVWDCTYLQSPNRPRVAAHPSPEFH